MKNVNKCSDALMLNINREYSYLMFNMSLICRILKNVQRSFPPLRFKSSKGKVNNDSSSKKSKRYADSLNLPKTLMPLTMKDGAANEREQAIRKTKQFQSLYAWQQQQDWNKRFVLHDGPPYANGKTHVGHVVNKVLKDITNRYKVMMKHKVHYVPGWDCHGMPIEIKAITDKDGRHQVLSALEIRERARKFAEQVIEEQRDSFQSWGIMGDWRKSYKTFNPQYESKQLEVFYNIYQKGYMYRDYMPVYWSPSSQTALAEAELEYNPTHVSKSVYVKFPVSSLPHGLSNQIGIGIPVYAVVWTTTPWTLPFNQAICYNPSIRYCLLRDSPNHSLYLCEEGFVDKIKEIIGANLDIVLTFDGSRLESVKYTNPLTDKELPFLCGEHVLSGKGTGLVHTAPAHGHDDFAVAIKYDLPRDCHVNGKGEFISGVTESLLGKTIGYDAETTVIELLEPWILKVEDFTHSYPYDWRTKQPVIIQASKQWFIDTSKLKEKALDSLSQVRIIPQQSEKGMLSEIISRPYWCISRQRTWGVPIPVFYHKENGEELITKETVDHLISLVKEYGSDCWWNMSTSQLLPNDLMQKIRKGKCSDYIKGEDILDIWFDSGVSWASVLQEFNGKADVYLEGVDQYKGWFQTSLLTSAAVRGVAPYSTIVTHGFATDETGKKMSKSVGNVVDPEDVIQGGKDKREYPSHGVDVLRWWVAHSHHHQQIMIGPSILKQLNEDVFKIRKCLRHMVGCLHDFHPISHQVLYPNLSLLDKYILHILYTMMNQIVEAYENVNYHRVVQHIEKFIYADLSSFYMASTKDRSYCDHRESEGRRSCQTTMYHLTKGLTAAFAPILPHLADEIHQHIPHNVSDDNTDSVFKCGQHEMQDEWNNPAVVAQLIPIFDMRQALMEKIGKENPVRFDITISASPQLYQSLKQIQLETTSCSSPLCEIFQTSQVTIADETISIPIDGSVIEGTSILLNHVKAEDKSTSNEVNYKIVINAATHHICERCRRYTSQSNNTPCKRCLETLAIDWS